MEVSIDVVAGEAVLALLFEVRESVGELFLAVALECLSRCPEGAIQHAIGGEPAVYLGPRKEKVAQESWRQKAVLAAQLPPIAPGQSRIPGSVS